MKSKPKSPAARLLGALLGAALLFNGLQYLALLVAGTPASAEVRLAVRAFGARNPAYRVYYEFQAGGRARQGTATLSTGGRPSGSLPVRYLALWPEISYPAHRGLLAAYGLCSLLPGTLLLWLSLRRTRR
jgi:hypothetical protein